MYFSCPAACFESDFKLEFEANYQKVRIDISKSLQKSLPMEKDFEFKSGRKDGGGTVAV